MRRFAWLSAALMAANLTPTARAADFTLTQSLGPDSWAGPYLGGNLGYAWGSIDRNPTNPSGFVGGVQGGFNWHPGQRVFGIPDPGRWVFGVEGDIQVTGAEEIFAPWKFSNPWFGTVRGRGGYLVSNVLLYATAGLAFGELRGQTFGLSESHINAGWTAGIGAEVDLAHRWSAKIEYLYVDLADSHFVVTGAANGYRFGLVRAGVNYHF